MNFLNIHASFFAFENPVRIIDRWFNDFRQSQSVRINQRELVVSWTGRADRALQKLQSPLMIELQLYFSCVVKKRVLFHRQVDFETTRVNPFIEIAFRPIASAACNPEDFARDFPEGKDLSQGVAARMVPTRVEIDYRNGQWYGQFAYGGRQLGS